MKIQIHKNKFKEYFRKKWKDVPEFLTFETDPCNWVAIKFGYGEKKELCKKYGNKVH